MIIDIDWEAITEIENVIIDLTLEYRDGTPVGYAENRGMMSSYKPGQYHTALSYDVSNLAEGTYQLMLHISTINETNELRDLDHTGRMSFEIENDSHVKTNWQRQYWGSIRLPELIEVKE